MPERDGRCLTTALLDLYRGRVNITGGTRLKDRIQFAFGAEFVEVRVHARSREIRVPRIVAHLRLDILSIPARRVAS